MVVLQHKVKASLGVQFGAGEAVFCPKEAKKGHEKTFI